MFNKGGYAKIVDKATGKVIVAGEIIAKKESDEDTVIGEEAYQKANLLAKELNRLESVLQ